MANAAGPTAEEEESLAETLWSRTEPETQYGGETFELASAALRHIGLPVAARRQYLSLFSQPRGARALAQVLRSLPRVAVRVTDSSAGQAVRAHLQARRLGLAYNRIAQGVLPLPSSFAEYRSGRSRQAMRTNLHRAADAGISCGPVAEGDGRRDLLRRWLESRPRTDPVSQLLDGWMGSWPSSAQWWAATAADGQPLATAVVSIDAEWALLHSLLSSSHPARWALHSLVVQSSIAAGARCLCVHEGNALLLSPQLQYFQRLLGYRIAHLGRPMSR